MDTQFSRTKACTCGADRSNTGSDHFDQSLALQPIVSDAAPPVVEPMMTMDEVCELLRTSKSTIYSMRSEGRGPVGVKIGRRILFRPSDIRRFCERNESGPRE